MKPGVAGRNCRRDSVHREWGWSFVESYFPYIIDSVGMKETIEEDQCFLNTRPYFSFTRCPERVQRPGILLTQV